MDHEPCRRVIEFGPSCVTKSRRERSLLLRTTLEQMTTVCEPRFL